MGSNDNGSMGTEVDSRLDDFFGSEEEDSDAGEIDYKKSDGNVDDYYSDDEGAGPVLKDDSELNVSDPGVDIQQGPIAPPPAPGGRKAAKPPAKPAKAKKDTMNVENSDLKDLKDLKSIILSLEWEITDQLMLRLNDEVTKLEKSHKEEKILVAFLQLLGSLGKYVHKKKAGAHPDSIALLNSVYENLEQVTLSTDMTDAAKKKILVTEVNKYKQLKEQIKDFGKARKEKAKAAAPAPEPEPAPAPAPESDPGGAPAGAAADENAADIVSTLNKLGNRLLHELQAIREELRLLRENR